MAKNEKHASFFSIIKNKLNFLTTICILVIVFASFFACWFALHGDIIFHTDIARDFLLIEDVVKNKPLTLIGPRSGGIPGVFHGPLWTYLNVPAFIIGGGNPAVVGWFWVLLYLVDVIIIYKVGKLMISSEVGWIAAAISSVITAFSVPGLFNPFGAVMFTPLFIYFLFRYIKFEKLKDLLISLIMLGIVIQFQMAFGVPILVLYIPLLIFLIVKNKKYLHIFALLILIISLSTFILFDLRHQFLQTKSVINYLTGKENTGKVDKKLSDIFQMRIHSIINDGPGFITKNNIWLLYIALAMFGFSFYYSFKNKKQESLKLFYGLFLYFYIGYWLVTVLYKGVVWGYYYWPFLGLICLVFAATSQSIDKQFFYPLMIIFIVFNLNLEIHSNFKSIQYFGHDGSSWQFHYQTVRRIFNDAPSEFGYYIFTADQFGYSSRYAMNYIQSQYTNKKAYPYEKKAITYLLISPSDNPTINDNWWKMEKVRIRKKPSEVFTFKGTNFRIEKYLLTSEEIKEKSDENLIHTLIFR